MICRERMPNPNADDGGSLVGGRNDPNPEWCDCWQGECRSKDAERFGGSSDRRALLPPRWRAGSHPPYVQSESPYPDLQQHELPWQQTAERS